MKSKVFTTVAIIVCLVFLTACSANENATKVTEKNETVSATYEFDEEKLTNDYNEVLKVYDSLKLPESEEEILQIAKDKGESKETIEDLKNKTEYFVFSNDNYAVSLYGNDEERDYRKTIEYHASGLLTLEDYESIKDVEIGVSTSEFYKAYGKKYVFGLQERSDGKIIISLHFHTDGAWVKNHYTFYKDKLIDIADSVAENIGN